MKIAREDVAPTECKKKHLKAVIDILKSKCLWYTTQVLATDMQNSYFFLTRTAKQMHS